MEFIKDLPIISASKLKTFKTCHRQYYNRYIIPFSERPKDIKNVAALLGTALHKAIEERYRNAATPTAVFQQVMLETLQQWDTDGHEIIALDYFTRAMIVGKQILRDFDWDQFIPSDLELKFTLPFPRENPIVNITGVIDLIDGFLPYNVIDHKSDSYKPNQDELDNNAQFILYYWAMTELKGTPPEHIYWNHLRTNTLIEADIRTNYEDKLHQLESDIVAMINATHFPRINMSDTCRKRCAFYQSCYGLKNESEIEVEE